MNVRNNSERKDSVSITFSASRIHRLVIKSEIDHPLDYQDNTELPTAGIGGICDSGAFLACDFKVGEHQNWHGSRWLMLLFHELPELFKVFIFEYTSAFMFVMGSRPGD
jgi:hypothetical protein